MFEVSKEGYRIGFEENIFVLNSYRENNYPTSYVGGEHLRNFDETKTESLKMVNIGNPTLLFQRFVSNNIMHSFHDTWLPLLMTIADTPELRDLGENKARFLIGFDLTGPFHEQIYKWLGKYYQIHDFAASLEQSDARFQNLTHVCFENGVFGLSTSAQWYQYGYKRPEGPVQDLDKDFAGKNVKSAVDLIKTNLNLTEESKKKFVSIVSRKSTRLILNEYELKKGIEEAFPQYEVKFIGEESMTLTEMIETIHESAVMIGMHGALMILSMFLPPGAKLIEMYFFGVDPDNYTPYKTLAGLTGMNITYRSWSNPHEEAPYNYPPNPDRNRHFGGLNHLPASYQNGVMSTKRVPKHLCCYFPMWTYRLFQDTRVNVTEILNIMKEE